MTTREQYLMMVGLEGTGKTTYLAALWHVVEHGSVPGSLVLDGLEGNREYLNSIRSKWESCQPLDRTSLGSKVTNRMTLLDRTGAKRSTLLIPDVAGESYEQQFSDRQWSEGHDDVVRQSTGILLFIHPDKIRHPVALSAGISLAASIGDCANPHASPARSPQAVGQSPAATQAQALPPAVAPWTPNMAPTQVKIVDILQFFLVRRQNPSPLRAAVLVSAWDEVVPTGDAAEWVRDRLPLLHQFLTANKNEIVSGFYGVSAQGGDIRKRSKELLMLAKPEERISVLGIGAESSHDITAPIRWLMGSG